MAESNNYYVYQYYDPIRHQPIYIGKGNRRRAYSHTCPCYLKKDHPFYNRLRSMLEEGVKPVVTILNSALSETEAFQLENFYVLKIGRSQDNTGPLLNLTNGGGAAATRVGHRHSEETLQKMRAAHKGRVMSESTRQALMASHKGKSSWNKGLKTSDEVKKKLSHAHLGQVAWNKGKPVAEQERERLRSMAVGNTNRRGKTHTKETREKLAHIQATKPRKVCIVTFPDGHQETPDNIDSFSKQHGLTSTCLRAVARGEFSQHKGFKCAYEVTQNGGK